LKSSVILTKYLSKADSYFKFLGKISFNKLVLVESLVVVLVIGGYIGLRFAPHTKQLAHAEKNSSRIVAELKEQVVSYREELNRLNRQFHTVDRLVKQSNQMSLLMELVLASAKQNGIKCETLSPSFASRRDAESFAAIPVNANLKGSFPNLLSMLRAMESGEDRVNVVSMIIRSIPETFPVASAVLVIETYQPKNGSGSGNL